MGPAQVEPPRGRGDKYEACDWMFEQIVKEENMCGLKARWAKLGQAEKDEIREIFDDKEEEEIVELLTDDIVAPGFALMYDHDSKKEMIQKFIAFQ